MPHRRFPNRPCPGPAICGCLGRIAYSAAMRATPKMVSGWRNVWESFRKDVGDRLLMDLCGCNPRVVGSSPT